MTEVTTNRLFFALWPGAEVRRQIEQRTRVLVSGRRNVGRLTNPHRYHLTLLFLGNAVSEDMQQTVIEAAAGIHLPSFIVSLDRAGAFGSKRKTWWLGSGNIPEALEKLHEGLVQGLGKYRKETGVHRRFRPHLTICRNAGKRPPVSDIEPVDWHISEFMLVRSLTRNGKAEYEVLQRFMLDSHTAG